MPITIGEGLSFCGRALTGSELDLIRSISHDFRRLTVTELAATVCELLQWRRPNGALKTRECFLFLRELQRRGWLPDLPAPQPRQRAPLAKLTSAPAPAPDLLDAPLSYYQPITLQLIQNAADRRRFREYLDRYHYLGYRAPYGAQLRYWVRSAHPQLPPLAALLFTSAGWRMAPRDRCIGWCPEARQRNLPLVVDPARYRGTCYRAANWVEVGTTQGRGRMDRFHRTQGNSKYIFLYPLHRHWQARLCAVAEPLP